MSTISLFFRMFKDSLCQYLTNLGTKGAKRSVNLLATNFYKSFFKNILLHMNNRLSKTCSVHTYVTVNNKKTCTPCFSTLRFSRVSPDPLELQKIYPHLFISVLKRAQSWNKNFWNPITQSADIGKNVNFQIKS